CDALLREGCFDMAACIEKPGAFLPKPPKRRERLPEGGQAAHLGLGCFTLLREVLREPRELLLHLPEFFPQLRKRPHLVEDGCEFATPESDVSRALPQPLQRGLKSVAFLLALRPARVAGRDVGEEARALLTEVYLRAL